MVRDSTGFPLMGWPGCYMYINVRHCGGLSMVLLPLKALLELFVKRMEFLPASGFLTRRDMTQAVNGNVKSIPSFKLQVCFRKWKRVQKIISNIFGRANIYYSVNCLSKNICILHTHYIYQGSYWHRHVYKVISKGPTSLMRYSQTQWISQSVIYSTEKSPLQYHYCCAGADPALNLTGAKNENMHWAP